MVFTRSHRTHVRGSSCQLRTNMRYLDALMIDNITHNFVPWEIKKYLFFTGVSKFKRTGLDKLTNKLILWVGANQVLFYQ